MAIATIPFIGLNLVPHAAGGVILSNASGYIANTYVSAGVVEAFATAGAALQTMGTSAAAIVASNPVITSTVVIAVVALGGYCYFHGIPAPVTETLTHSGLATASKKGLMIAVPKLATALVLLGAAGYVAYRFYEHLTDLAADKETAASWMQASEENARGIVVRNFGNELWETVGQAAWATKAELAKSLATMAQEALARVCHASEALSAGASAVYDAAAANSNRAVSGGQSMLHRMKQWMARLRKHRLRA